MTRRSRTLAILVSSLLALNHSDAHARGSAVVHDDPWNPFHVDQLPPDIRAAIIHMCRGEPRAGHYFATYLNGAKMVRLHFEFLQCAEHREFRAGQYCLREDFGAFGSRYRLTRSYYARCDE